MSLTEIEPGIFSDQDERLYLSAIRNNVQWLSRIWLSGIIYGYPKYGYYNNVAGYSEYGYLEMAVPDMAIWNMANIQP